jgi:phosphohistidine swiveling domain-containing protein
MDASALTLTFAEVGPDDLPRVGGNGANLAALARAGVAVPPGFCVTSRAYDAFIASLPDAEARFAALERLDGTSVEAARAAAESMRSALERLPVPRDVAQAVMVAWRALGTEQPLAVRSSATAEDLPGASFAGQQSTYLNVIGEAPLLDAVRRCWISLFTHRAVLYRARGGFGHRAVRLSVVVQRMIDPDVSGILFTADPVTGHRRIASIDAGFGLGEALVSGLISADLYRVDRRTREVLLARPGNKELAIRTTPGGGTRREVLPEPRRLARALSDEQVRALAEIADRLESFFGGVPQDIEWCIAQGTLYIVQARLITSLFPVPGPPPEHGGLRVFLSFGHLQMMLDAMPRLALQVWQLFLPAGKAPLPTLRAQPMLSPVMLPVAGRLYIDVTGVLRLERLRATLLGLLHRAYDALGQSIATLVSRPGFREGRARPARVLRGVLRALGPVAMRVPGAVLFRDPAAGAAAFDRAVEEIPRESAERVRAASTPAGRIRQCAVEMNALFSRIRRHLPHVIAGAICLGLLRRLARGRWAEGVRSDVDLLLRGLPGNVTTQMDLAVGDLTDLLRPHPELAALVHARPWAELQGSLHEVPGGRELSIALRGFLARYGDRGAGEIDLSRPRWRDDPSLLLRVMSGGLTAEPGAHWRHYQAQVDASETAAARLVTASGQGPSGLLRRRCVRRLVRVVRLGMGLREHPKFIIVKLLGIIRVEVLAAGETLAQRGRLAAASDVWHLGFDEIASALEDKEPDLRDRVAGRAADLRRDQARKPPIAISSDGEIPAPGAERADLPSDALPGTPASAGVVEGLARVVTDPTREVLRAGEILVAPFTDPGWTPLFIHAVGVVTEVGGMMTHGAVVAREYGIPAVVSVASAVERIKTGQRIRVDGTRGFVQILGGVLRAAALLLAALVVAFGALCVWKGGVALLGDGLRAGGRGALQLVPLLAVVLLLAGFVCPSSWSPDMRFRSVARSKVTCAAELISAELRNTVNTASGAVYRGCTALRRRDDWQITLGRHVPTSTRS